MSGDDPVAPTTKAGRRMLDIRHFLETAHDTEWRDRILAIEAEAAAPSAPQALDVERLEQAIQSVDRRYTNHAKVERIAANYARLAPSEPTETER